MATDATKCIASGKGPTRDKQLWPTSPRHVTAEAAKRRVVKSLQTPKPGAAAEAAAQGRPGCGICVALSAQTLKLPVVFAGKCFPSTEQV